MQRRLLHAICAFAIVSLCLGTPSTAPAQQLYPLPDNLHAIPTTTFSATGSGTQSNDAFALDKFATNTSGQLLATIHTLSVLNFYLAFNRGASLAKVNADSVDIKSLLYPDAGNSPLVAEALVARCVVSCRDTSGVSHDLGVYGSFIPRDMNATRSNVDYAFSSRRVAVGALWRLNNYFGENRFRVTGSAGYAKFSVNDADASDFRATFNNPSLPLVYSGLVYKVALQFNTLNVEYEYPVMHSSDNQSVRGLTGGVGTVRVGVMGKLLSF